MAGAEMAGGRLTRAERAFFGLLVETVFANPFGCDTARLSRLIGREADAGRVSQAESYGELMPALTGHLAALAGRGRGRIQDFPGDDQELMRLVFLFDGYQRHIERIDGLIHRSRDSRSGAGTWIGSLLAELGARGFDAAESRRFVALYYQLRRAYWFIENALIGRSAPMRALRSALWNSIFTTDLRNYALLLWDRMEDFSTLLLGETGTGKGSAAAAIGRSGPIPLDERDGFARGIDQTFVATNLSEFPESLIESELFGHRKGAFTGAVDHHEGLFARCPRHATLFLDEIGDVSLPVQTKLLRVLQERRFSPVGSHETRRFEGRVIAATNRSLDRLLGDGRFRADLFYRLSANVIQVPSLRGRLADCPGELEELVSALLARLVGEAGDGLVDRVLDGLKSVPAGYTWPGNVRELEQAVRRVLLNGCYVPDEIARPDADPWLAAADAGCLDAEGLLGGYCRQLHARLGTYEAVARVTGLDRRTVKRHVLARGAD